MLRLIITVYITVISAGSAIAASVPRYGIFVYSSLCFEKQSGDAKGYRLTLLRYSDRDHVVFEWSEGPLYEASAYNVRLDAPTSELSFRVDVPGDSRTAEYSETYTAKISTDALLLRPNSAPGRAFRVPRLRDLNRKIGTC